VSRDLELDTNVSCEELTVNSSALLSVRWCLCFVRMETATSSHCASSNTPSRVGVRRWKIPPWVTQPHHSS